MTRIAGRARQHPDVVRLQIELARAHIDLGHTQAELAAARDQLADEQALTRQLRNSVALAPYNNRPLPQPTRATPRRRR